MAGRFTIVGSGRLEQSMDLIVTNRHGDWKLRLSLDTASGRYHGSFFLQDEWRNCEFEKLDHQADTLTDLFDKDDHCHAGHTFKKNFAKLDSLCIVCEARVGWMATNRRPFIPMGTNSKYHTQMVMQ